LTREKDNLLGQHRVTAVSHRKSLSSPDQLQACLVICWMKRARMAAGSKLAEYSATNAKFIFYDKVGHVVWQASVISRSWLHPRRHNTRTLNRDAITTLGCSCECDVHVQVQRYASTARLIGSAT
jgi:hypothetical protein